MYRIIEGNTNTQNAKYIAVTFLVAMMSKVEAKMYTMQTTNSV